MQKAIILMLIVLTVVSCLPKEQPLVEEPPAVEQPQDAVSQSISDANDINQELDTGVVDDQIDSLSQDLDSW